MLLELVTHGGSREGEVAREPCAAPEHRALLPLGPDAQREALALSVQHSEAVADEVVSAVPGLLKRTRALPPKRPPTGSP